MNIKDLWVKNITGVAAGNYRTMNGNADEMIAIGRIIKAGFACSRVDVTNAKYDAIVDIGGKQKLLRIQIKGTSGNNLTITGGTRSGVQIDKKFKQKAYKYTKEDCDLIIGVNSNNGDCYIIPIEDTKEMGGSLSLKKLENYKENWQILNKLKIY